MHELLLFGQVPATRHVQLLKIIAGIAGMQPKHLVERHLLFKPKRTPGSTSSHVGGSQGIQNAQSQALQGQLHGELFFLQVVGEVDGLLLSSQDQDRRTADAGQDHVMRDAGDEPAQDVGAAARYDFDQQRWSLRFNDLPEVAGRRPVTSRMISGIDIIDGDLIDFMDAFGYSYLSEYVLEGHRVIYNNVILLLHRVLRLPPSLSPESSQPGPRRHLPNLAAMTAIDPTGAYVLQASIRVQDGSKPESMTLGINELKAVKDLMKGVVELEVGDRLALDTRVR